MLEEQNNTLTKDDPQVWVFLRNHFYKKKYHSVLGVYFLSFIAVFILAGMLIYLYGHPTEPIFFATDEIGRLMKEIPVSKPNMSNDDVAAWVVDAVESSFSFDFMNYRAQLQDAQKYFTDYGWRTFLSGLTSSNNLTAVTQRKMVIIAKVVQKPKLEVEGLLSGAYAWKFTVPVLVTYLQPPFDNKSSFQNPLAVSVTVQRRKFLESYKGLGVLQMIGTLVLSAPPQNLANPPPSP